jgi:hypothetical protein
MLLRREPAGIRMSSIKDPEEKKRLSLARDHRTFAEYPKAHRNSWPRRKAGANRQSRRSAKIALAGAAEADEATLSETMTARLYRKRWPVLPLAKAISMRLEQRSLREFGQVRRRANRARAEKKAALAAAAKQVTLAAAKRTKQAKRFGRRWRRHDLGRARGTGGSRA